MPTPFMHLEMAERMAAHEGLPGGVACRIDAHWPAFYLGNVAADFQTICDVPREEAHFYKLPPARGVAAHEVMLERYPQLARPEEMAPAQAVFIAGYRAHLLLDLRWYWDVLIPFFIEAEGWPADHRRRFLVHNTLLTYLDGEARATLPADAGETLAAADPHGWLPFASDGDLIRWRDLLVRQLRPGAQRETVAIYAERMNMRPEAFSAHLADPEWMEKQVFRKVPLEAVEAVLEEGLEASVGLVADYLRR